MSLPPYGSSPGLADSAALTAAISNFNKVGYAGNVIAAGVGQTDATQLAQTAPLVQVNDTGVGTGVRLPPAIPGAIMLIFNNGNVDLLVYGFLATDYVGGGQSPTTITASSANLFFCALANSWGVA